VHEEDYHDVMLRSIKKIITSAVDGLRVNVDIDRGREARRFVRVRGQSTATSTNRTNGTLRGPMQHAVLNQHNHSTLENIQEKCNGKIMRCR
jgi:hypothetical protein